MFEVWWFFGPMVPETMMKVSKLIMTKEFQKSLRSLEHATRSGELIKHKTFSSYILQGLLMIRSFLGINTVYFLK